MPLVSFAAAYCLSKTDRLVKVGCAFATKLYVLAGGGLRECSWFTVAVGVFRRGGSQELAPAMERDRGGVPCHSSPEPEVDSERGSDSA